ncbi:MAG: restriction endonuclease subunit S [Prevotella sp.]|nr:restriction endonuclease subunit S [Prevotella sp.]
MVEWKTIGDIVKRNKGIPITAGQMSELNSPDGNIRVFAAGQTIADIDEANLPKGCAHKKPSIIVKSRGYIDFEFYDKPFTHKNEMWSYSFDDFEICKFIYYYLTTKTEEFRKKARANSVKLPQLCVADTDNYIIPIPSLEEQNRIVGILDTFTDSIENLKQQIAQRRKQFEFYRDQLLDLEGKSNEDIKMFGDYCTMIKGNGVQKTDFVDIGIGCIHYGQIYTHYGSFTYTTNKFVSKEVFEKARKASKGDIIMTDTSENVEDICKSVAYLGEDNIAVSNHALIIKHEQNPKFLSYSTQTNSFFKQKQKCAYGVKVTGIKPEHLAKFRIYLPSLSEQQRIVSILDTFEACISNLEAQLAQRQKQYEYYRNQLLTFE